MLLRLSAPFRQEWQIHRHRGLSSPNLCESAQELSLIQNDLKIQYHTYFLPKEKDLSIIINQTWVLLIPPQN